MQIQGEGFLLRRWILEDIPALAQQANNPNVVAFLRDRFPHPYTEADARAFISANLGREDGWNFAIIVEGQPAGGIGLIFEQDVHRFSAEVGYWLGEAYWGQGLLSKAVRSLVDYAFEHTDLLRIHAAVFSPNKASMRVLEKNGFQFEGILRHSVVKNGVVMDQHIYALLKP